MDRKSIIGIALAVMVFAWAQYMQSQAQLRQRQLAQQQAAAAATPEPAATVAPVAIATPTPPPEPVKPPEPAVEEVTQTVTTDAVVYTFTNRGGGIAFVKLLHHQGAQRGELMVLNAVAPRPIGALTLKPEAADAGTDAYDIVEKSDTRVVFQRTAENGLLLRKIYNLDLTAGGQYRINLEVDFHNPTAGAIEQSPYFLYTGAAAPLRANEFLNYIGFDWYAGRDNTFINANWFTASRIPLVGIELSAAQAFYAQSPGNVAWAGVRGQYFTTMILAGRDNPAKGVWARPFPIQVEGRDLKGIEGYLQVQGGIVSPGASVSRQFTLFAGPAELRQLAALGHGAEQMMNLDRWWINRTVGNLLLRSMNFLERFLPSYAWAIIVLTFIVRGLLWPIQGKANRSMKQMQLLMPKQTELREKYKDDPAKMNQEIMKLYRDHGVNPLSGCLPMMIQIPIFIGFFSMLGTAVELRNSSFLWVQDLSRPDTLFYIAGFPINILPLMMAATMVWMMQLTPKAGDPMQQKMMMFMPIIFVVFTYNFASALALYYTVQNLLSIVQLYVTRNQPAPELQKVKSKK